METRRVLSAVFSLQLLLAAGCAGRTDEGGPSPEVTHPGPDLPTRPQGNGTGSPSSEPPPISGGTLLVQKDGVTAIAADPDRDRVWIVDLSSRKLLHEVKLSPGDQPGRVVEDQAGWVHVVLRGGGALLSIDPIRGAIIARRPVCAEPRGLAYDSARDVIHVACAGGELVSFLSGGGDAIRTVHLDRDLRDVVVQGNLLYVSRFRSAELLQLAEDGSMQSRLTLPVATGLGIKAPITAVPSVAWRVLALPGGGMAMLHQRAQKESVSTKPGGYNSFGMCKGAGIVHDAVSVLRPPAAPRVAPALGATTGAVDLAVSPDGTQVVMATPGSVFGGVVRFPMTDIDRDGAGPGSCAFSGQSTNVPSPIAVAYDLSGHVVVQSREPSALYFLPDASPISLPGASVASAGHELFHRPTQSFIACVSCHPEAGDDGRVWQFDGIGARRTQNLRGGVLSRAPFHWSGDISDMTQLMHDVFVGRMGGGPLDAPAIAGIGHWLNAQPALRPSIPADANAADRGRQIFQDSSVGCVSCHSGPQLSRSALVNVGTGGTFKVPSLLAVGHRAPYLHDGCATGLRDRFSGTCGGGEQHGHTQQLAASQLDDLVAYLETL